MSASFKHHDLRLLNPSFDSPLIDVLQELEHLRKLQVGGTTPVSIFLQLKSIFHMLESLGSARIEGNHTTLTDYIDSRIEDGDPRTDQLREIENIEQAMDNVDRLVTPGTDISEQLIRSLHSVTVSNLVREGDLTPGAYRTRPVAIQGADHLPPDGFLVPQYMTELVTFINAPDASKYDLIKVALAHHRFGWVHPFSNGNGRVVRLLTYAMLLKYGFNVGALGRVLNPTAVFCNDREKYYAMLSRADAGDDEGLEAWCHYVLSGVLVELKKLDLLTDYEYLRQRILGPAIALARERELITVEEALVLRRALESDQAVIRSRDLAPVLPELNDNQRTYRIKALLQAKMLEPTHEGARQYTLCFSNSRLLRGVVAALRREGFVSAPLAAQAQEAVPAAAEA